MRGTRSILFSIIIEAGVSFICEGVEISLLPSMSELTVLHSGAPIFILGDEILGSPIRTHFVTIFVHVWFSSEILPVVSIEAVCLVVLMSEWTPLSF